ncbi:MAG: hypothetical protein ACO3A2_01055 [Bdellovibrionia bacterium]
MSKKTLLFTVVCLSFHLGCVSNDSSNSLEESASSHGSSSYLTELDQPRDDIRFEFYKKNLTASLNWLPATEEGRLFEIKFWNSDDQQNSPNFVDPQAKLRVSLKMTCACSHVGRFSGIDSVTDADNQVIPGVYHVVGVQLPKLGEWIVELSLMDSKGNVIDRAEGIWIEE